MTPSGVHADHELAERACTAGLEAGLDAVGVCGVEPFLAARRALEERRRDGHHAGMAFTFRRPRRSTEPVRLLRNAASMIVGARSYLEQDRPEPPPGPCASIARYAWRDHYAELRASLGSVADALRSAGHRATIVCDQNGLVDRAAAHRAGIGWWGKNTNLLLPERGSWFVLGAVVTDALLPVAEETVPDGCRTCSRCRTGCPTDAIVADGVIDARRCLAWLVQTEGVFPRRYRVALGDRLYGCDDCQEVCPPNRRHGQAAQYVATDAPPRAWVQVADLLRAEDDELMSRYGQWYIPNRDPRYLRRNALVVLGNVGSAADGDQRRLVAEHCEHPDDLLRAHAVWAAARLGLTDLVSRRSEDDAPVVRAEVALAPSVPLAPGASRSRPVQLR